MQTAMERERERPRVERGTMGEGDPVCVRRKGEKEKRGEHV
jgi:hypothetical protein